jgi:hypothetical protein
MAPVQALNKNVAAGFVTTNPTVKLTFPTDNSTASQLARLNAAAVTLQNLEGPGVGCPISSTTFSAQQKAIEAETSNATSSTNPPTVSPSALATSSPPTGTSQASTICSYSATPSVPATTPAQTSSPASPSPSSITNVTSATLSSGNATTPTDAQISALAPPLGWQSGINPDGTCDICISRSRNSSSGFKVLETVMEL